MKYPLFLILLALLLAGCGPGQAGVEPAPTSATPVPELVTNMPTATAAATQPAPVETSAVEPTEVETIEEVSQPLGIAFIQEGDVWFWQAGAEVVQLTQGGGVEQVQLSDDDAMVAFSRGGELWAVAVNGAGEQSLVNLELLAEIAPAGEEATPYDFDWLPNSHLLLFNTQKVQGMGLALNDDLHTVDADTLAHQLLLEPGQGGRFYPSPDGSQIAIVRPDAISMINADGSGYQAGVVTYEPVLTYSEFRYYPKVEWATDSSAFAVAVPPADPLAQPLGETSLWRVPANGEGAQAVGQIVSSPFQQSFAFSPDLAYVAYLSPSPAQEGAEAPPSSDMVITAIEGGTEAARFAEATNVYGWSPDGRYVAFQQGNEQPQAMFAGVGQEPRAIGAAGSVSIDVRWVAPDQYLYLQGPETWQISLGQVDGETQVLASVPGMPPSFDSNR